MKLIDKLIDGYMRRKGLDPNTPGFTSVPSTGLLIGPYQNDKYPKAFRSSEALYSVASLLIRKASSIPLVVYERKKGADAKKALYEYQIKSRGPVPARKLDEILGLRAKALEENSIVTDGNLAKLIMKPNENMSQDQFLEAMFGFRLISGEANIWGNSGKNPNGRIVELQVLPTNRVEDVYTKNDVYGIDSHFLDLNAKVPIPKENLLRWKNLRLDFDPTTRIHMRGLSVVEVGWNSYLMGDKGSQALANMLAQGGAKGALSPKVINNTVNPMSDPQLSKAKREVNQQYNGVDNAGTIGILAKPYDFLSFGLSAVDLDIVNVINLSVHQWCRLLGCPTVLFDSEHTSDNNYQNAMRDLVTNTIMPMNSSARDRLNSWLPGRTGTDADRYYLDFDYSMLPELQRDTEKLVNALSKAYWLEEDEKRAEMGYEPKGGPYKTSLVPSGLQKIEDVGLDMGPDPEAPADPQKAGNY
jgi:HK97 family phage portal protein